MVTISALDKVLMLCTFQCLYIMYIHPLKVMLDALSNIRIAKPKSYNKGENRLSYRIEVQYSQKLHVRDIVNIHVLYVFIISVVILFASSIFCRNISFKKSQKLLHSEAMTRAKSVLVYLLTYACVSGQFFILKRKPKCNVYAPTEI